MRKRTLGQVVLPVVALVPSIVMAELPEYQLLNIGRWDDVTVLNDAGQVAGAIGRHAFLYSDGEMIDLGTLGGRYSAAYAINDAGQVTGSAATAEGDWHAFLYTDGQMIDLGGLGDPSECRSSVGHAINEAAQVTGIACYEEGNARAFLYSHGRMVDLGTFGGDSSGLAINNAGQVAGTSELPRNEFGNQWGRGFLYSNGEMIDLGTLGGSASYANGINEAGQVIGASRTPEDDPGQWHGFLYSDGEMIDLGTLESDDRSDPSAINESGQVMGTSGHAYLYSDGEMIDLGTLGGTSSWATDINDTGQVTGQSYDSGGNFAAFVYSDGVMRNLGTLGITDPGCCHSGNAINNAGQILGIVSTNQGEIHSFLATPISLLFSRLLDAVTGVGTGARLVDRVMLSKTFYDAENGPATCGSLKSFIKLVRAQSTKTIPLEKVEDFIEDASAIRNALGCQ